MIPGKTIRLPGYDYRSPGWYLVTIVISGRRPFLSRLRGGEAIPTRIGRVVVAAWEATLDSRPWVSCAAVAFMPDHFHAVVGWDIAPDSRDARLGKLIQHFKGSSAGAIHATRLLPEWDRLWQSGYHDRIIRTDRQLRAAIRYVEENPRRG